MTNLREALEQRVSGIIRSVYGVGYGTYAGEYQNKSIDRAAKNIVAMVSAALSAPAPVGEPCAYLRDMDGTGSLHPAAKGDPGAFAVYATAQPSPGWDEALQAVANEIVWLTTKWGNPNGTQYEQGAQDHGRRLHDAIRALRSGGAEKTDGDGGES